MSSGPGWRSTVAPEVVNSRQVASEQFEADMDIAVRFRSVNGLVSNQRHTAAAMMFLPQASDTVGKVTNVRLPVRSLWDGY